MTTLEAFCASLETRTEGLPGMGLRRTGSIFRRARTSSALVVLLDPLAILLLVLPDGFILFGFALKRQFHQPVDQFGVT